MPVITNHTKLSASSETGSDKSSYTENSKRVSILSHKTISFEERFVDNIIALENTYGHKMVRRPNKASLRASMPSTYFSNGKYNTRNNYGSNDYSKRYEQNRLFDKKQLEKRLSYEYSRHKSDTYGRNQDCLSRLSLYDIDKTGEYWIRKKNLRLPPVMLPPIHTGKPPSLTPREVPPPAQPRGPITDEEWSDLQECRYLRPGLKKFRDDLHAR